MSSIIDNCKDDLYRQLHLTFDFKVKYFSLIYVLSGNWWKTGFRVGPNVPINAVFIAKLLPFDFIFDSLFRMKQSHILLLV